MNCNKLHVNLEKSCYKYFNNTISILITLVKLKMLKISDTSLSHVEQTKYFGVIIDNKLTRIRVIFGDREKNIDKFRTCVRARPFSEQK